MRRFVISCLNNFWQPWFSKKYLFISDDEFCYRRIPPRSVHKNRIIPANAFDFPNAWCFRSRWSDAVDALSSPACDGRALVGYGVVRFKVRAIRAEVKIVTASSAFSAIFDVLPEPIRGGFAHSEISSERRIPGEITLDTRNFDEEQRAQLRANLAYRCEIVIAPNS